MIGYARSMPAPRRAFALLLVPVLVLLAAGCGGGSGKEISEVRACLDDLELTVEGPQEKDKDIVEEGVFASTDLTKAADGEFAFALAAIVKDDDAIKKFQKDSEAFSRTAEEDEKLDFQTGVDGKYVWVAGGSTEDDTYADARKCVKP